MFGAKMQAILQIGKRIAHIPGRLRQILGFKLDGAGEKTDDAEIIARVKRAHQTLHRQRDFFCRGKTPFPAHRPAHIQEQHRRRARVVLRLVNRKIPRTDPHRHAAAVKQRVLQRLNHVDVQRIALHIRTAGFENHLLAAAVARRVPPHAVAPQLAGKYHAARAGRPAARLWESIRNDRLVREHNRPLRAAIACA